MRRATETVSTQTDEGRRTMAEDVTSGPLAPIIGLHHIRVPVSDAWISRDWYMAVLGFRPVLDLEEENGVVGVVLRHDQGLSIGLHRDRSRAASLKGFAILGLTVENRSQLERWAAALDRAGVSRGALEEGHLGFYLDIPDPDGILIRLHTRAGPNAEEA
jgi:catechol 2,3-dioxygenase-like lactoylglutathione lyase family enzyme